jgi:hypothetical protein
MPVEEQVEQGRGLGTDHASSRAGDSCWRGGLGVSQTWFFSALGGLGVISVRIRRFTRRRGANHLQNAGFASTPFEFWQVDPSEAKQHFWLSVDRSQAKRGQRSLPASADQPVSLTLHQEVSLPVGTF